MLLPSALFYHVVAAINGHVIENSLFLSVQREEEASQISISRVGFSPMCHGECNCNVTLQGLHVGGRVVYHKREDCSQNTN